MLETFVDLWDFLGKVIPNLVAFITGSVFAVALIIYQVWSRKQISISVAGFSLVAFLFTSSFLVWRDEYSALKGSKQHVIDLEKQIAQLTLQLTKKCPPDELIAYESDWFTVSSSNRKKLPENRTGPQIFGGPPAAIKVSVDKGSIRYLDTGQAPTRTRGHLISAGDHVWICGPSIAQATFVSVGEPDETLIQVTYHRPTQ
jgi:hypothetical protein